MPTASQELEFTEGESATRSIPENTPAGINVGAPVSAEGDGTLTYTLSGPDAASFTIVPTTGQVRTRDGVVYDYETKNRYTVTVGADDESGESDTIDVTIHIEDLVAACQSVRNLRTNHGDGYVNVKWNPAMQQEGKVRVLGYQVEMRRGDDGPWTGRRTLLGRGIGATTHGGLQNTGSQHGLYTPTPTVTSVEFTSNPGDDQTYGPGDVIQATVTFDQEVTVRYTGSKRQAASLELEMNGETRTAYYERTDGKKVIFEYTVLPGDEAPVALKLPLNSLKLFSERGRQDGSIQNSEGTDAVLDHYGLADTGHRVDAVRPEFASAQVSNDGTQVAVTFNEGIQSPAILRAFSVQTSLLQSLALDVRVDGEIAVRSNAAVSGDTVTLTVSEPITQGQTVTVSYDNLFIETGESIFEDLRGNSLLTFAEQPASNGSTVADVDRPGGGLALSRNDLLIKEGQSGTYTVVLTSQPAADVNVAIGQRPPGRATVSPTSLTFTADNWNTPQTVTISSTEDSNYLDRWVMLRHTATGDNYRATAAAWLILRDNYNLTTATANTPAAGSPTIGGTPEVGQTLTLDTASIADAEGLTNASYTYLYQWHRNGAEIPEATNTFYTLVDADEGKTIKVKVSFTDDANNAESRTSAATVAVAPRPNNSPTGAPTINGTPQVRRTLSVDTSSIADADGMETAVFRYQWLAATDFATLEFHGENSPTYTLGPLSEGLAIKVKVSFTDDRGHSETLTSAATEAVIAAEPNSEPTGLPTIGGTPQVGETLTADTSAINDANGLTNVSYTYVWMGTQVVVDETSGIAYTIGFQSTDQTDPTYTLTPADQGATIKVQVTFTDDDGYQESLTSAATRSRSLPGPTQRPQESPPSAAPRRWGRR